MGQDEADRRLVEHIIGTARNEQVGRFDIFELLLPNREGANIEVADASRELEAAVDADFLAVSGQADTP